MSHYQPIVVPGATYFFTVRLKNPRSKLLIAQVDLLRQAIRSCRQRAPFHIGASVILPNRLHMIWTLPPNDGDYGRRWKLIKTTFARHAQVSQACRTAGLWQRRFWECPINSHRDLAEYEELIRQAAVTEKLVKRPEDWPYCTLQNSAKGVLSPAVDEMV